jgi:hypothetical protein
MGFFHALLVAAFVGSCLSMYEDEAGVIDTYQLGGGNVQSHALAPDEFDYDLDANVIYRRVSGQVVWRYQVFGGE